MLQETSLNALLWGRGEMMPKWRNDAVVPLRRVPVAGGAVVVGEFVLEVDEGGVVAGRVGEFRMLGADAFEDAVFDRGQAGVGLPVRPGGTPMSCDCCIYCHT